MNMLFADTLKKLRKDKGLSQQALAEKLYVTNAAVSRWESGHRLPDAVTISRLSGILGVDINILISAAAQSDERPNVIMLDDNKIILNGGLPILDEVLPNAAVIGFTKPSEAIEYAKNNRVALAFLDIEMGAVMILNLAGLFRRRKKLSKRIFVALLVYMLPMTAALILHMFFGVELIIVTCMALFALIMFGLILSDNMERYMRQQLEIADQRAGIMVLQMRPHFIYNTMMTIYYLCKQDADKAQQVTLNFTDYLRKNFTAIASEDTVPFADELKHTKAYLAVEQAQHEDSLFVEYNTPHTYFCVPPLTLQPLVENAVKHGMNPDGDPLHIYVKTRQSNNDSEIIVENDGPDFNPANDNEPHIALNNIRQRLEMMCKGTLTITRREGGGTAVKVFVPQDRRYNKKQYHLSTGL